MERKVLLLLLLFGLSGCTYMSVKPAVRTAIFQQDVNYKMGESESKSLKKGERLVIQSDPVLVSSKGFISMLIFPAEKNEQLGLNLTPISSDRFSREIMVSTNNSINSILGEILLIQDYLAKKQAKQALASTELLIKKNPDLTVLKFLEASCLLLLNKKEEARLALKAGLRDFPNHKSALSLYDSLGGDRGVAR